MRPSLSKKLFTARVELIAVLDKRFFEQPVVQYGNDDTEMVLRGATVERLREEVAAMNLDNFIVRPKRRWVEKYVDAVSWKRLDAAEQAELVQEVAGLPSEFEDADQNAKQFDLIMLRLQLAVLTSDVSFKRLREQVQSIARLLEENSSIPMIHAQLRLIQELHADEYWADVTAPMLENVRKRLRDLIKLIERSKRKVVYSDFEDEIGAATHLELIGVAASSDYERFREKARQFLKAHSDAPVIRKLRRNEPLSQADLEALERMLLEAGIASGEELLRAREESKGLDRFVRSLVGLDREAAKKALGGFLMGRTLNATQIDFIDMIIDHLTQHGAIDAALLYESPFTDFSPLGIEGVFSREDAAELVHLLSGASAAL